MTDLTRLASDKVVARFCPSPTGNPHVGMARTALFSWAFARHHGGDFVFRIEDTDASRDSEESYELLVDVMRWLGLDWDQGVEVGGPDGPYRQSERMDIYVEVTERLLDAGLAYKAYDTAEELEERRELARHAEHPELRLDRQSVAGLDLDRRDAFGDQVIALPGYTAPDPTTHPTR